MESRQKLEERIMGKKTMSVRLLNSRIETGIILGITNAQSFFH